MKSSIHYIIYVYIYNTNEDKTRLQIAPIFRPTCRSSLGWMKKNRFCPFKFIHERFFFIHPEEDPHVGRNISVLYKRVLSSFVFYTLLHEENIYTYWLLVKYFIYIYIYTISFARLLIECSIVEPERWYHPGDVINKRYDLEFYY